MSRPFSDCKTQTQSAIFCLCKRHVISVENQKISPIFTRLRSASTGCALSARCAIGRRSGTDTKSGDDPEIEVSKTSTTSCENKGSIAVSTATTFCLLKTSTSGAPGQIKGSRSAISAKCTRICIRAREKSSCSTGYPGRTLYPALAKNAGSVVQAIQARGRGSWLTMTIHVARNRSNRAANVYVDCYALDAMSASPCSKTTRTE